MILIALTILGVFLGVGLMVYGYLMEVQNKTRENLPLMLREHLR